MACGGGWAWLRDGHLFAHICGARGPRGPLTAVVEHMPVLTPGQVVELDMTRSRRWRTPGTSVTAPPEQIAAACAAVRPHAWNDPRARALGRDPRAATVGALVGRGPGLTPAGDDVLAGYVLARRAIDPDRSRRDRALVLWSARHTGEPARSLLLCASRGEAFSPAATMLAALLAADGPALAPGLRRLRALGATTGRAMLTGMLEGIAAGIDAAR